MHFRDDRQKLVLKSNIGKQIIEQLRVRPSVAMTPSEPVFESVRLPEIPAVVSVPTPEIYEEHQLPAAYPGAPDYSQHEQLVPPEIAFSPQLRFGDPHPIASIEHELSAAAEISQAVELATHPDSVDGLLQPVDSPEPFPEQGLESLLDDPLLGPLGPLF